MQTLRGGRGEAYMIGLDVAPTTIRLPDASIAPHTNSHDSHRPHAHARAICCRRSTGCSSCRRTRSARIEATWQPDGRRAGVHRRGPLSRRAAGPSGRRASSSARRCCSSTPPASASSSSSAASGRSSGWRRTSRTSASTITASTTSAPTARCGGWRAKGGSTRATWERALLRAGAEGQRRRAGAALDARCPTAASSTRSTARTRCSSTPSARCARWRSRIALGHRLIEEQDAQINLLDAAGAARARDGALHRLLRHGPRQLRRPRPRRAREPLQRRQRHATAARARSRATRRSPPGPADWRGRCSASPSSSSFSTTLPDDDARRNRRPRERRGCDARGRARDLRLLHRARRAPTACRTGTPARRGWRRSATGATAPPIRSTITSRSTAPRRRSRAQGLLRLGRVPRSAWRATARRYEQAGLARARHAVRRGGPYLSAGSEHHQGLLLHSVYHRPNGWDHVPPGSQIPRGESSQWGDYHVREAALYVQRLAEGEPYLTFFGSERR